MWPAYTGIMVEYLLLFWFCAMAGILIPAPEDLALVAAGVRVHEGTMAFPLAAVVAGAGILLRDGLFYGLGRVLGERVLQRPVVQRLIGGPKLERARRMFEERGNAAVLISRMLIGFRSAAFLVAGTMGVRPAAFLIWDLIGLLITVPAVIGLGLLFGEQATAAVQWTLDHSGQAALIAVLLVAVVQLVPRVRRHLTQRHDSGEEQQAEIAHPTCAAP